MSASPAPAASTPPPESPPHHLLRLIADALTLPEPAVTQVDKAVHAALMNRRVALVLVACQETLAGREDFAARDLYGAVSGLPATSYQHLPATGQAMST